MAALPDGETTSEYQRLILAAANVAPDAATHKAAIDLLKTGAGAPAHAVEPQPDTGNVPIGQG